MVEVGEVDLVVGLGMAAIARDGEQAFCAVAENEVEKAERLALFEAIE